MLSDYEVVHRFSSSVTMSAVYDYETSARDDPLVLLVIHAMDIAIGMMTQERAMILKMFPFRECSTSLIRKFSILLFTLQY